MTGARAGGPGSAAGERLVRRVARFGRVLRDAGAEVGAGRVQGALEALDAVDVTSRDDAYWALRCTLISRHEDLELFDTAFAAYWEGAPGAPREDAVARPEPAPGEEPEEAQQSSSSAIDGPQEAGDDGADDEGGAEEQGLAWSAVERLRELDFAEYGEEEMREARRLLEHLPAIAPLRRSRRLRPARDGQALDKRRTLRNAMRTDGSPVVRQYRQRRLVPRKLVFVVDVSGSMRPYARAMLMFLHAAVRAGRRVEAFTFGTRLTRVTRPLQDAGADRALRAAARAVPDWAGGTRIGENLRVLNDLWGRRGVTRGAVVVIVSDGWERGEVDVLAREIERLSRAAHTLVWVNPLAGEAGYEPLAQGMAAALPHLDEFLAGHNLASLDALAAVLEGLPAERHATGRRRGLAR